MIAASARQVVNEDLSFGDPPHPGLANTGRDGGLLPPADLDVVTANVAAWGGHVGLFHQVLAAGLGVPGAAPSVRAVVVVAGWRAGVLGLREEALRLLPTVPRAVAAAALGFSADSIPAFVEAQHHDPYWWPWRAAHRGRVLSAGGFQGLGGTWVSPPEQVGWGAVSGRWVVSADDRWWQLEADVFGASLVPWRDGDAVVAGSGTDPAGVLITCSPDSYLVTLSVPAESRR